MEAILLGLLYINLTMKKILFIILLCLNIQLTYGIDYSPYSNRYSGYTRVSSERTYERIGYTSQYGDGFSNNKSTFGYPRNTYINPKSTFGKTTYDNYHYNAIYPGNTYDNYHSNYSSGGGGRPGQPRKVKGYDGNGNEIGDKSPESGTGLGWLAGHDFWEDEYKYTYYYVKGDGWYRSDGKTTQKWTSTGGWHWSWFGNSTNPPSGSTQGYHENPVPIGDGLVPLSLLCLGYILYRRRSNFFV